MLLYFPGSEWRYVILSTVRSLPTEEIQKDAGREWRSKHVGFVGDPNQINVGITRAKEGLCIIGEKEPQHLIFVCAYVYICACVCLLTCVCLCMHWFVLACRCVGLWICLCTCVFIRAHVFLR